MKTGCGFMWRGGEFRSSTLLYTAATTHLSLGLWALYQRRHFRYTAAEITQLVLGFSIPLLLASHFGVRTRCTASFSTAFQTQLCESAVRPIGFQGRT